MTDQKPTITIATASYPVLEPNEIMLPGEVGLATLPDDANYFKAVEKAGNKVFIAASKEPGDIGVIATIERLSTEGGDAKIKITAGERGILYDITPADGDLEFADVEVVQASNEVDMNVVTMTFEKFREVFKDQVHPDSLAALETFAEKNPTALADKLMSLIQ